MILLQKENTDNLKDVTEEENEEVDDDIIQKENKILT